MKKNVGLVIASCALTLSAAAEAATISGGYRIRTSQDFNSRLEDVEKLDSFFGDTTVDLAPDDSISGLIATDNSVGARASASYDITTGEMKAFVAADRGCTGPCPLDHRRSASAGANVSMAEQFVASADGTVTFYMEFDGGWGVTGNFLGEPPSASATGTLTAFRNSGSVLEQSFIAYTGRGPFNDSDPQARRLEMLNAASPNELLAITFDVFEGLTYTIEQRLSIGTQNGAIDFTNTVSLAFETTPGLSLLFSDSAFLSNMQSIVPGGGDPIPLPAAGWFMLAGLGGLVSLKKKRAE